MSLLSFSHHQRNLDNVQTNLIIQKHYGHRAKCWYSSAPAREVYCRQHLFSSWVSIQPIWFRISFVSWPKLFIGREWKFWFNLRTDFTNNRHMYAVSLASPLKLSWGALILVLVSKWRLYHHQTKIIIPLLYLFGKQIYKCKSKT